MRASPGNGPFGSASRWLCSWPSPASADCSFALHMQMKPGCRLLLSIGNDAGNFIVVLPLLVISAILALRGSVAARLVWTGALAYLAYDFLNYAFAIHFNPMFLAYCGVLGVSFYALAGSFATLPVAEVVRRYGPRAPVKTASIVLLLMGGIIVFHWLSEIVPALLAGRVPQPVRDSGLLTESVAVLDLSFGAPACLIAAVLLLRRKPMGFVLVPIVFTFLALSSLVLAPMGLMMARRGFASGYALCTIGLGTSAGSVVLLALSLRRPRATLSVRSSAGEKRARAKVNQSLKASDIDYGFAGFTDCVGQSQSLKSLARRSRCES